jgi:hypothetical protein
VAILSAKPITSNNISTITATAAGSTTTKATSIKIATSNLFIDSMNIPTYKTLEDFVLETLNSGEILDYSDTNLVTISSNVDNSNNSSIDVTVTAIQTNPQNILLSASILNNLESTFYSNLDIYIPKIGSGTDGESVYIDENNSLIIDTVNVREGDEVEIEFWKYETELNDTIYS